MRVKVLSARPMGKRVKKWLRSQGETIVEKNPDILIVAYYPRILRKEEFESIPLGAINFHPGYLPYNRGMYPHIWPIVDGTPCGVTIHYIDEKIDHGKIIGQRLVPLSSKDIASDSEKKTQETIFQLFTNLWPKIKSGKVRGKTPKGPSTYHPAKEISSIQEFDKQIIDRLRACTFHDRSYAYFMDKGQKVYVGVKFFSQKDLDTFNKKTL